ncbi:hypothetical protein [Microvirga sp. VF16]|uniref:hypothetical protein n=1 Tax=Microvirga sp. VF16 TaxID=2807101 RepID=UPI00193D566E|nr:hypothetical protein [Microvirga sp. VF16]QRM28263.1 hypothetical protein JO965_18755 [Microvirga sp. VF16]
MSKNKPTPKQPAEQNHAFDGNRPPAGVVSILQQRALVWGESAADYDALFSAILEEIMPITTLQWLHVKHLTDLAWEIHRYRRLKTNIINLARIDAVETLLTPLVVGRPDTLQAYEQEGQVRRVAHNLQFGNEAERSAACQTLTNFGIKPDDVTTQSMVMSLPDVMKLESLIASAEGRMVLLLRDVNRLKDDFAARLQRTASALQDRTLAGPAAPDPELPQ